MKPSPTRRALLAATLPWLAACTTPLPLGMRPDSDDAASDRLRQSAMAHGLEAFGRLDDISVGYDGQWRPLVGRIQPDLVDAGYRGGSQERLLLRQRVVAQAHSGPLGMKQVVWQRGASGVVEPGEIHVWRNDVPSGDLPTLQSAALVAEAYGLFLLGPLWLKDRTAAARLAGSVDVDGRKCDVVEVWLRPGLGRVAMDRVSMCIDRSDAVARRFTFTLEGTPATQGAVAEVDTFDHVRRHGMLWPTRFYERVVHPIRIPAHDWHLTGVDVNRGIGMADISGPRFLGAARAPAASLA